MATLLKRIRVVVRVLELPEQAAGCALASSPLLLAQPSGRLQQAAQRLVRLAGGVPDARKLFLQRPQVRPDLKMLRLE